MEKKKKKYIMLVTLGVFIKRENGIHSVKRHEVSKIQAFSTDYWVG